ncbi:DUF3138 family protein [Burkholderia cepacia]|uniref:DUF3138 family protein n=1 Tax=Burkholderia cepacia TaxID=292 RepID=UPI001CF4EE68|nr:DUF3138 family protein [Burkholderia cepacia]MCA7928179.1 DUF3138 family protein [Burkholderia cepacia]
MKLKHMTALCLLAFDAATAFAHTPQATDASRMKALQAQVTALQQQVNALRASMLAAQAPGAATAATAATAANATSSGARIGSINTVAAAAPAADSAPAFTNDDLQQMREQIANASLKVDSLQEAATTGPLAGLSITGYVDPVYLFNRAQRTSGFQFLNHDPGAYDYFNSTIGDVYLDIKKTFGVGPMAPSAEVVIQPNRGFGNVFSNSHGGVGNNIVTQAVVTVPLSTTRTFEIGMMPSLAGYEVQPSTQMLTLTHGLLYDFSEPGNLIGVGLKGSNAAMTRFWQVVIGNEVLRTAGAIANAANNTTKTNWTPTITARFDNATSTAFDFGISGMLGRQSLFSPCATAGGYGYQCNGSSPTGLYKYVEADVTYTHDKTQVNAQVDYGELQKGAWNGGTARWYGMSLLGHTKWTQAWVGRMGATLRFDYLNNTSNGGGGTNIQYGLAGGNPSVNGSSGFGIDPACFQGSSTNGTECKGAQRYAITADLLFYPTQQITVKLEYRHDAANHPVFLKSNGTYARSNDLAGMQFIYSF